MNITLSWTERFGSHYSTLNPSREIGQFSNTTRRHAPPLTEKDEDVVQGRTDEKTEEQGLVGHKKGNIVWHCERQRTKRLTGKSRPGNASWFEVRSLNLAMKATSTKRSSWSLGERDGCSWVLFAHTNLLRILYHQPAHEIRSSIGTGQEIWAVRAVAKKWIFRKLRRKL